MLQSEYRDLLWKTMLPAIFATVLLTILMSSMSQFGGRLWSAASWILRAITQEGLRSLNQMINTYDVPLTIDAILEHCSSTEQKKAKHRQCKKSTRYLEFQSSDLVKCLCIYGSLIRRCLIRFLECSKVCNILWASLLQFALILFFRANHSMNLNEYKSRLTRQQLSYNIETFSYPCP